MTFLTRHCKDGGCICLTCAKAPHCRFPPCRGDGPGGDNRLHSCNGHFAKGRCDMYDETPHMAMSYGWCQNCSEEGIELTEQVYSAIRGRWLCKACGGLVVTPERNEELKELVKNITANDIYGG